MLHALYQIAPLSTRDPARSQFSFGLTGLPQSEHDRATVLASWRDALIVFDARILLFQQWSTDVQIMSSRIELNWCIACLAEVRSALYQLHVCLVGENLPLTPNGLAIVSYLSEAYVWCGDVLENVEALVQELRGVSAVRNSILAADSSAYIRDFLEPLLDEMRESGRSKAAGEPAMGTHLSLAERLRIAIVSLDWLLNAP